MNEKELREAMRRMGARGGRARAAKLTNKQRTEIARKAGKARQANRKEGAR